MSKYWGPQPKLAKWIFLTVVKPRVAYAALVWEHSIQTIAKKQRLGQLNRLAATIIIPTIKKHAREIMSGLESVRIGKVSEWESVRMGKCQNWKVSELFGVKTFLIKDPNNA